MAASCAASSSRANRGDERQSNGSKDGEDHGAAGSHSRSHSDAAIVLHLDLDELAEEAADSMREKLQLTTEEWNEWEEQKEGCLTEGLRCYIPTCP